MPPKQDKTSADRLYGLSDSEMKTSISVLRLLALDGNIPIDKNALARLTGHDKPNSAVKIWSNAKAKLIAANAGSVNNAAAGSDAPQTSSSAKPVKRARANTTIKAKSGGGKKAVAPVKDEDEEEEEEEEDDSSDDLNEPAPKRSKKQQRKKVSADDSC